MNDANVSHPDTARRSDLIHQMLDERRRQDTLIRDGEIDIDCTDPDVSDFHKLAVLAEEFGEVAKAMLEDTASLQTELIQVAAVAFAWCEALHD